MDLEMVAFGSWFWWDSCETNPDHSHDLLENKNSQTPNLDKLFFEDVLFESGHVEEPGQEAKVVAKPLEKVNAN